MSIAGPVKPWHERDLFELIGWRTQGPAHLYPQEPNNPLARWERLIMANTAARREAKGALFGELAEAVRQGMPLEEALSHASQTLDESKRRKGYAYLPPGAQTRHRPLDMIVAVLMTVFGHLGYMFYGLLALRMTDVERISRLLAMRLRRYIACGHSLSEAMRRCGKDYDESEIQMIAASEKWSSLAEGLKRLSQFQISEQRLTMMGTLALYPFWMGGILLSIASFCLVFILPKYKDIYDQLGSELPKLTQELTGFAYFFASGIFGLLMNALLVASLAFFLLRGLMNGTRFTKLLLALTVVASVLSGVIPSILYVLDDSHKLGYGQGAVALIVSVASFSCVLIFFLVPYLLHGLETLVLRIERWIRPVLRYIPVVGRAMRVEQQARWLGSVALGLSSNVTPGNALRSAGMICGGALERRSFLAADMVDSGHAIGQACIKVRVLRDADNHRLALLDGRPDYLEGLRSVADDSSQMAYEWLNRSGRIAEVFMIIALGLVAALFAIAMYLPLFNIPSIVGREDSSSIVQPRPDYNYAIL